MNLDCFIITAIVFLFCRSTDGLTLSISIAFAACAFIVSSLFYSRNQQWTDPRLELFDDQTADEAGLVFGDVIGGSLRSENAKLTGDVYYSGETMTLADDSSMYFAKPTAMPTGISQHSKLQYASMNKTFDGSSVLGKLRFVCIDQTSFDTLKPLKFGELLQIVYTDNHIDRYIVNVDGKLTFDNDKPVSQNMPFVFKLIDVQNPLDTSSSVTAGRPFYIQFAGTTTTSGSDTSFVYTGTDGTLNTNGGQAQATKFHIGACMQDCVGPYWKFS